MGNVKERSLLSASAGTESSETMGASFAQSLKDNCEEELSAGLQTVTAEPQQIQVTLDFNTIYPETPVIKWMELEHNTLLKTTKALKQKMSRITNKEKNNRNMSIKPVQRLKQ